MAYEKQTWTTGDIITANKLNYMEDGIANASDKGYECVDSVEELFNGGLTTEAFINGVTRAVFSMPQFPNAESIYVTIDGTQCELPLSREEFYGEEYQGKPSFENYPCAIGKYGSAEASFYMPSIGTYQVKVESPMQTITTTDCFAKAIEQVGLANNGSLVFDDYVDMEAGLSVALPEDFVITRSTVLLVMLEEKAELIGNVQYGSSQGDSYYHMDSLKMSSNDNEWFIDTRFYGESTTVGALPFHPSRMVFSTIGSSISESYSKHLVIVKIA